MDQSTEDPITAARFYVSVWANSVKDAEDRLDWLRGHLAEAEQTLRDLEADAASLTAGPDIPLDTGGDAVTDQPMSTCNTTEPRNFLSRVDA